MMTKSFVNKGENRIDGKAVLDSRIKELEFSFRDEKDPAKQKQKIDLVMANEPVLLCEKENGVLKGVGVIPGTKVNSKSPVKIQIFDDGILVIELEKNVVLTAYQANVEADRVRGVNFLIPLSDFAVPINYRFQHQMTVLGDTAGLVFFFE